MSKRPRAKKQPAPERLAYKPREAALALGLGMTKVYELIASGDLPVVYVPSRSATATRLETLITRADLEAWLAKHRHARAS